MKKNTTVRIKSLKLGDRVLITNEISGKIYDFNYCYPKGTIGRVIYVDDNDVVIEFLNKDRISISKKVDSSIFLKILNEEGKVSLWEC